MKKALLFCAAIVLIGQMAYAMDIKIQVIELKARPLQTIIVPQGARIVDVRSRECPHDGPWDFHPVQISILADFDLPLEARYIRMYKTGDAINDGLWGYVGSFQALSGAPMHHVFQRLYPLPAGE